MHRPETLYEGNLFHVKNITGIKQLCNHKVLDFAMAFQVRKRFGTFGKRAPEKKEPTTRNPSNIQFSATVGKRKT